MSFKTNNISVHAPVLQVQPLYRDRNDWMALSLQEGLFFEPLEFFMQPVNEEKAAFDAAADWYRTNGRVTSLHGAFIDVNPASGDHDFCALSRKRCHESCRLAAELGAEQVVFHASAHPFIGGGYLENWSAKCADFYMELSETYHLGIRVENSQDTDPEALVQLMKRIQRADVAVCLDIGHANYSNAPLEAWFDLLGEHIRYMHFSDNMGRYDDHLPVGRGNVDWKKASALWAELGRSMPVTFEVGGISGVKESLAFLRSNGYFGMKEVAPDEF